MRTTSIAALLLAASFSFTVTADDATALREATARYEKALAEDDIAGALEAAREAYEIGKRKYGPNDVRLRTLKRNYGLLAREEAAEDVFTEDLARQTELYGENAVELVEPLMALADFSADAAKPGASREWYGKALAIASRHDGPQSFLAGKIMLKMGQIELTKLYSRSSRSLFQDAEKVLSRSKDPKASYHLAKTHFWMAKYDLYDGNLRHASKELEKALDLFQRTAPDDPMLMVTHKFLARTYQRRKLPSRATKHCLAIGRAKAAAGDLGPEPIYKAKPEYPRAAMLAGQTSSVLVRFTVDKEGFVVNPTVAEVQGTKDMIEPSLEAIRKFRYVPRFENGEPVETSDVTYFFGVNMVSRHGKY